MVPDGLFERAVDFGRENDLLVVHDASYTEITYDGYSAPSFLETPGAKDVGVEVFSLSKGYNMTGWRTAAIRATPPRSTSTGRSKRTSTAVCSTPCSWPPRAPSTTATTPRRMSEIYAGRRDPSATRLPRSAWT